MTGETENGMSISETRKLFPLKSNLEIDQAAAIPKTMFTGTAIAATMTVRRTAESASGSASASSAAPIPLASAEENTVMRGRSRKTPM